MIIADKIIRLRKKNGWSQEELAEKMNTSRQAVSKWEGAQSVPDIGKILQLSVLFGVTTDYLIKDEIEDEEYCDSDEDNTVKKMSLANATEYLNWRNKAAKIIAFATFLCIMAPVPLILLGAASEVKGFGISENFAGGMGLIVLFLLVAVAVGFFVLCGFKNAPYEFLDTEPFANEYGVKGMVQERQNAYHPTYAKLNIFGTILCVLSPVSLFVGAFLEKEFLMVVMLAITLFVAGVGTFLFILAGVRMSAMRRLLKEGEYAVSQKKNNAVIDAISTVYWLTTVAIYLGISFTTNDWKTTWIVWPIAGVLFAAIMTVCNCFITKKNDSDK